MTSWNLNPSTILIINGNDAIVPIEAGATLRSVKLDGLRSSGTTGRPAEDFEVRTSDGLHLVDESVDAAPMAGMRFFVTVAVGCGG